MNSKILPKCKTVFQNSGFIPKLPKSFENFVNKSSGHHVKPTRFSSSECLYIPCFKSATYSMNSLTNICIHSWNKITEVVVKPSSLPTNEIKTTMYNVQLQCATILAAANRNLDDFPSIFSYNNTLIVALPALIISWFKNIMENLKRNLFFFVSLPIFGVYQLQKKSWNTVNYYDISYFKSLSNFR